MLLILVIIGVSATQNTSIELQIAGNDKVHRQTFYQADGGTELGIRLTYENALCVNVDGFANPDDPNDLVLGKIIVDKTDLSFATPGHTGLATYYPNTLNNAPSTSLTIGGVAVSTAGAGFQDIAGYDYLGKSAAAGGTHLLYDIQSRHSGETNSQSGVDIQWKLTTNIVNNASSDDCQYD